MVKLPTVDNVPSIDPKVTRDPGVVSSPDDFGAGIFEATGDFGEAGVKTFNRFRKQQLKVEADKREQEKEKAEAAEKVRTVIKGSEKFAKETVKNEVVQKSSDALNKADLSSRNFESNILEEFGGVVDNVTNDVAGRFNIGPDILPEIRALAEQSQAPVFWRGQIRAHNARVLQFESEIGRQVGQMAVGVQQGSLSLGDAISRSERLIDSMADVLPDMDVALARDTARRQLTTGFVDGLIDQNPAAAIEFFDETPRDQLLDGLGFAAADIAAFRTDAVAERGRRETAGAAEAGRLMRDELARLSPGKFLDVGDVGDGIELENRIAALAGPEAAEAFREVRGRVANVRRTVEDLALLPKDEIAAMVENPVGPSNGSDAEATAAVRRGAAQMLVAREDDPVGFFTPLIERALGPLRRVPGFADADADPARLAVGLRLQAAAGVAKPRVLAKAEAGEIAAGLAKLKPSEQAEQIRTLEARFGDAFPAARAELAQNGGAMIGAFARVGSSKGEVGKGEVGNGEATRSATPADPAVAGQITALQDAGPAETAKATPPEDRAATDTQLTVATSSDDRATIDQTRANLIPGERREALTGDLDSGRTLPDGSLSSPDSEEVLAADDGIVPSGTAQPDELADAGENSELLAQAPNPAGVKQKVPANTQSPVPNPKIRDDSKLGLGDGRFGASRGGGKRTHKGVDLEAPPGTTVQSPVDGTMVHIGEPYKLNHPLHGQYDTIWVRDKNGTLIKMFYVAPTIGIGTTIKAGDPIGTMQDRASADPGMTNHVHVEVLPKPKPGGTRKQVDPAPWLKAWGVK